MLKDYFRKEPSKGINLDEAGGILSGEQGTEDVVLIDVCPLTLSIKTTSGVFTKLITCNTVIPTHKSQIFSTVADNQPTLLIQDNNILGKFELSGIPSTPHGVPQIEVLFEINANGIMKVAAANKGIGKSESITITNEKGCLSKENIKHMVHKAEGFALKDEANHKHIEALNSLSSFIYRLKSQLGNQSGLGGKLSDDDKKSLLAVIKEAMEWIKKNGQTANTDNLEEKLAEIQSIMLVIHHGNMLMPSPLFYDNNVLTMENG
ncbi:heat shock protein 70 family [Scleroderma citrinum]